MPLSLGYNVATMTSAASVAPQEAHGFPRIRWVAYGAVAAAVVALWWLQTPDGLMGKADAIGYAVCHRIDLRSFHLGERALPLCARCSGMYLGATLGAAYIFVLGRGRSGAFPRRWLLLVFAAFGLLFAVDGVNSYLHFFPNAPHAYEPSNALRMTTGTLLGLGIAGVVLPSFNQNAWRDWKGAPVLGSGVELSGLLALAALLIFAVLSENPLILYPLALVSSAGLLVLLGVIYTTLLLLITRRENHAQRWRQLVLPFLGGLALAISQIAAVDLVRYLLTGTWGGFSL